MLCNDVYISIRAFIISDLRNNLHRILIVKSGKKTIIQQVAVFRVNFPFIGDIQGMPPTTVYRLYMFCMFSLKPCLGKES